MKVADIGEFGLIELVAKTIGEFKPAEISLHISSPPAALFPILPVLIDIGDDTAAWRTEAPIQLATTDTLVQDIHFSPKFANWRELGWKTLAVNISDIASMGGQSRHALITLGLPDDLEVENVVELYKGIMDIGLRFGVSVVGGDMVRAREIFITAALIGDAFPMPGARAEYLLRSMAKPGDKIAVTGYLGSSAAGLRMLSGGMALQPEAARYLREAHLRPVPRVRAGILIRRHGGLAAMDISDGLMADLTKVCRASEVGGRIYADKLPIHPVVRSAFPAEAQTLALSGGEDYELVFAAPPEVVDAVAREADVPVTVIGEITRERTGAVQVLDADGNEIELRQAGWDHFKRG